MQVSSIELVGYISCSWDDQTWSTTGTFSPRFPETATKNWYWKLLTRHEQREIFVKMSLRDQLFCFADFVGMTLLALRLLLPLPNCFLRVCFPTLFAAVLKFYLPPTTTAISGAVNYITVSQQRGTIFLRRNGFVVLPIPCAGAPNPLLRCRRITLMYGISSCPETAILLRAYRWKWT